MPRRSNQAQANLTADEVPPGAKQITRTTTEKYQAPIHGHHLDEAEVREDHPTEVELEAAEIEDELVLEDEAPKTALDSVLASLKGIGEITIYVIRKPDPIGLSFANPCNMSHTAGDLPFDESFTSKEAIELAVQSVYGGGKYQLQIRQNGDYVTAWTTLIADPRKRAEANPQPSPQYIPPQPSEPHQTAREQLREVLELAKDIADIRGNGQLQPAGPPLPAASPTDQLKETFSFIKDMRSEIRDVVGDQVPVGGERTWLDGAATLIDKLGVGQLVAEGGKMVLGEILRAKREAVMAEATAAANAHARRGPAEPPSRSNAQPALQAAPPSPPTAEQPTPTEDENASLIGPGEMAVLEIVVREIRAFEEDDDNEKLEERVSTAVAAVRTLPIETQALVNEIPPAFVLPYLIGLRADWKDLAGMTDAGAFIGLMVEKLREEPEEGSGEVLPFPGGKTSEEKINGEPKEETGEGSNADARSQA